MHRTRLRRPARALRGADIAVLGMTRIAWCSIDALSEALEVFDPDAVVSISSPQHPIRDIEGRAQLHLPFHDVEERSLRTCRKIVPDRRHVGALLELIDHHRPERLLIHCTAGLSRSPALAIVAAVKAGHDPTSICAEVAGILPHAQPNRMVLACASELLDVDIVTAAMQIFTYNRGHDHPEGERARLCEIKSVADRVEVRL